MLKVVLVQLAASLMSPLKLPEFDTRDCSKVECRLQITNDYRRTRRLFCVEFSSKVWR